MFVFSNLHTAHLYNITEITRPIKGLQPKTCLRTYFNIMMFSFTSLVHFQSEFSINEFLPTYFFKNRVCLFFNDEENQVKFD